jgi:light-regulated signal transduction histidine kinase (bacteriophytochrome)
MATTEAQDLLSAIDRCADEPIHIPGSIQPHGFLLVVSEPELHVQQASENVQQWLGVEAQSLLGQPLSNLLPTARLEAGLAALTEDDHNQFHLSFDGKAVRHFKPFSRPITAVDIYDYKLATAWGQKRPDDVTRRYNNALRICREAA